MNTEQARETVEGLELKLSEVSAKAIDLQTQRQSLSFDAATGDEDAQKKLDKANATTVTTNLEIENLHSAIVEAKRRLAEVRARGERSPTWR